MLQTAGYAEAITANSVDASGWLAVIAEPWLQYQSELAKRDLRPASITS